MFDELLHGRLPPDLPAWAPYAAGAALLALGYGLWRLCRKIVRLGFFVIYAAVGVGFTAALSTIAIGRPAPLPMLLGGGLVFSVAVMAIRSKIMRTVTTLALLVAGYFAARTWMPSQRPSTGVKPGIGRPSPSLPPG
ncbi:MAG: hypothetical protein HYR64_09425 [Fimbriimonas ginsengisoli]|uniref:Uncharacterized protein n=1 Tax=Fimbriimonas ginsengisoli TaxID=1005039 RepID=A0A931LWX0_FIMGI|nr:hypothetical protein [Fimbriimonas ginsengisoli]